MNSFLLIPATARALIISIYYLLILANIFLLISYLAYKPSKLKVVSTAILLAIVSVNSICLTDLQENSMRGFSSIGIINAFGNIAWSLHLFIALICVAYFVYNLREGDKKIRTQITPTSIAKSFDKVPLGLAFTTIDGLPLLTNKKMYKLAFDVTGKYFCNAKELWESFENLNCNSSIFEDDSTLILIVQDSNENYWQLSKDILNISNEQYIQITAFDVTKPYKLTSELMSKNHELKTRSETLKLLADKLVDIQREEEILASKIRIHNELGNCILTGDRYIAKDCQGDIGELIKLWREVIERLVTSIDIPSQSGEGILHEIQTSAGLLGCEIVIDGKLPANEDTAYILLTALREGVTNAVRHSDATRVDVSIREEGNKLKVLISDNGKNVPGEIIEGGGLSSLRKRINKGGGEMEISCTDVVSLSFTLPLNGEEERI